ncbi:MAG: hypothetical protein FWG77_04375 [Treponema sp.]|nr:hypothetical protein [Treponema sp.]
MIKRLKYRLNILIARAIYFNRQKLEIFMAVFISILFIGMVAVSIPPILRAMLRVDRIDVRDFIPARSTNLSSINLISANGGSTPALLQMIDTYYFESEQNRENIDLYVSTVTFRYLRDLLIYLEQNQIPAILNTQSESVLFTGYNMHLGLIHILDPNDPENTYINYRDLINTVNTITISSNRLHEIKTNDCTECNHQNIIDGSILYMVTDIYCNNCGNLIPAEPALWL